MAMGARTKKEWIIRSVILMVGLVIAHFGVTLFLLSDLGSDPFNVLVQGITRILTGGLRLSFLTHGRVHMAICILIMFALLFIDRTYVKIGTLICVALVGPVAGIFLPVNERIVAGIMKKFRY